MYFFLSVLDNTFERTAFAMTLLSGSVYTWYNTQYYAKKIGHATG